MNNNHLQVISLILCLIVAADFSASQIINNEIAVTGAAKASAGSAAETVEAEQTISNKIKSIRKVDFQNFTYEPLCLGDAPTTVKVKNGKYAEKGSAEFSFEVNGALYGDINGDGKEEAVIKADCWMGGTAHPTEGFIYGMRNGKPALLTRIEGGDRGRDGLVNVEIKNNLLVVEQNDDGELGADCCPEFITTTKYRLRGNKLVAVGKPSSVEFNPSIRISFENGKSSRAIVVKLKPKAEERYKVAARAGQTITVTGDSKDVDISVLNSTAETTEIAGGVKAKLATTRDCVIDVTNRSSRAISVKLTIEFR